MASSRSSYNTSKPYKASLFSLIQKTWKSPYFEIRPGVYPTFIKKFSFSEVDHTDGIGTKGYYHWQKRTFKEAVQDALAMNINDLLLVNAKAYKLQSHITLHVDNHKIILEIIGHLADFCQKEQIVITGGETSIHDNIDSLDLSVTMSGLISKLDMNQLKIGDTLYGLPSSGLHSNGFSAVRRLFKGEFRDDFTVPTTLYHKVVNQIRKKVDTHGMMHITGGAYTKLLDILPKSADAIINANSWAAQPIFWEMYKRGMSDKDMYRSFNCGIGLVFSAKRRPSLQQEFPQVIEIGQVQSGSGKVFIRSAFSSEKLSFS